MSLPRFNGSCYAVGRTPVTHGEAERICKESYTGHLWYIETRQELDMIPPLFKALRDSYWIGLTIEYSWLNGDTATDFSFGDRDERRFRDTECIHTRARFSPLVGEGDSCRGNRGYICERTIFDDQQTRELSGRYPQTQSVTLITLLVV